MTSWEVCHLDNVPLDMTNQPLPRTSSSDATFEFQYGADTDAEVRGPRCRSYVEEFCDGMRTVEYKLNEQDWKRTNSDSDVDYQGSMKNVSFFNGDLPTIRLQLSGLGSRVHTLLARSPCAPLNITTSYTWEIDVTPPNTTVVGGAIHKFEPTATILLSCSEGGRRADWCRGQ